MNEEPEQHSTSKPDFSARTKVLYFFMGNIVPSLLLMGSARSNALRVDWQSGNFHDYAALLVSGTSGWIFYPFFIYAVAMFTLGALRPQKYCRSRAVLFGVLTGIVLSLQTCFMLGVVAMELEVFLYWRTLMLVFVVMPLWGAIAIGLPWFIWWLGKLLYAKRGAITQKRGWLPCLMFLGPLLGLVLGGLAGDDALDWVAFLFLFPSAFIIASGPFWIVGAYISLFVKLLRFEETQLRYRLSDLFVVSAWIGAYIAAWRLAVEQAVETYATLPTTPPSGCYIATAAAKGHPSYVRSFRTRCLTGEVMIANSQLQILKCGELALKALYPRLHRLLRRVYDQCGPVCAACLFHPLAADLAYTALKPLEYFFRTAFYLTTPRVRAMASRLYTNGAANRS